MDNNISRKIDKNHEMMKINVEEIKAINGLRCFYFFLCIILVSYYFQMDLIKKNRWKDMEMMGTNKGLWILSSIMYLYIDYLYFLTAFISCDKIFNYLKQQDDENEKRILKLTKKNNIFA